MLKGNCTRLCSVAFGVAMGVVTGLCMLFLAWSGSYGYGSPIVILWSNLYVGYAPTLLGGLIGFLWGFLDGFIAGIILAWVYNAILCCCRACYKKEEGPRVV